MRGLIAQLMRLIVALAVLVLHGTTSAEDWPHWRGAARTGIVDELSGWDGSRWIAARPDWTANVGEGASSPLLVDERVFALGHRDGRDIVSCLHANTGDVSWSVSYQARKYGRHATGDEGLYSGPSSTPEYDPSTGYLYTLGTDGDLHCWNTRQDGQRVWHRNLYDVYQMPQRARVGRSGRRDYGYTSAPFVYRDWLLVEAGGSKGTIVALDKRTGNEIWGSQSKEVAGHTGGMAPLEVEGVPCVAALTFSGLLVVRIDEPRAGETVATFPWVTDFANNIAGPAGRENCLLITSEYNHGAICKLRITLTGAEKLWEKPWSSKACTPVIHDGRIYMAWNRLRCLDWDSGNLVWEGPVVGDAGSCVVTSDDKLIVWCHRGDVILGDLGERAKFKELARVPRLADNDVWPHVVLANRKLLCRDRLGVLRCFSLPR